MNILFFSNDGKLGDAVLHTALVKGIKQHTPNANIYCTTAGATTEFWQRDARITQTWAVWKCAFWQIIKIGLALRKKKLDYIISWNPIKAEKIKLLCWLANPKHGVKVFIVKPDEHASIKEQQVLEFLGYPTDKLAYDIAKSTANYEWDHNAIYLNVFASVSARTIPEDKAVALLDLLFEKHPARTIYMTYFGDNIDVVNRIAKQTKNQNVTLVDTTGNMEKLLSLCEHVALVITPDTAVVHLASGFNKPVIGFFAKNNPMMKVNWSPKSDQSYMIDFFDGDENDHKALQIAVDKTTEFLAQHDT